MELIFFVRTDGDDVDDWSMIAQAGSDDDENVAAVGDRVTRARSISSHGREAAIETSVTARNTQSVASAVADASARSCSENALKDVRNSPLEAALPCDNSPNLSNEGTRSAQPEESCQLNKDEPSVTQALCPADSSRTEKPSETTEDLYGPRVWEVHAAFLMAVLAVVWVVLRELVNRFTAWMRYPEL